MGRGIWLEVGVMIRGDMEVEMWGYWRMIWRFLVGVSLGGLEVGWGGKVGVMWRCGYGLNPDRAELSASNLPQPDILSKTRSSIMPYHNP